MKKRVIIGKEEFDVSESSGILGLMFSRRKNIMFKNSFGICNLHMLFVFFPIDAVFVQGGRAVMVKRCYPFQPFVSGCECDYVIELAERNNVKKGMGVKLLSKK